jgi:hypothetical protein
MKQEFEKAYCSICHELINVNWYYDHMDSHKSWKFSEQDEIHTAYYSDIENMLYDQDEQNFEMYIAYLSESWNKEDLE